MADRLDCHLRRARSPSRPKPSSRTVPGRGKSARAVDERETGSANYLISRAQTPRPAPAAPVASQHAPNHAWAMATLPLFAPPGAGDGTGSYVVWFHNLT